MLRRIELTGKRPVGNAPISASGLDRREEQVTAN